MMSDMTHNDDAVSVVEELDPEPPVEYDRRSRSWHSTGSVETALGIVILLGVLGWGGFTWWRDESNSANYRQAQQAASLRHWDEALAHYSSASGYRDADARAADALTQIKERDSQYDAAMAYRQKGSATQMLLASRAVLSIEPGYKGIDQLALQAEEQVYTDVLSGTVVMRTKAQPQGLYYRGPSGWTYLRESDRWSSVLSIPFSAVSAKRVVYDIPGPNWVDDALLTRLPFNPYEYRITEGLPNKVGRRLIVATLPGAAEQPGFEHLELNPVDYTFYICGAEGVWGIRYDPGLSDRIIAKGVLNGFTPTYEETGKQTASVVARVVMPGADGVVVDFGHGDDEGSDRLLLAAHGPRSNKEVGTQLYLTRADGSDPRVVFSTTGTLVSALLSPDDRHALVVASEAIESPAGKQLVFAALLTLDGSMPPRMLQKIALDDVSVQGSSGIPTLLTGQLTMSGVFLEKGAFKNKLLLGWSDSIAATSARVWLLNVTSPDKVLVETNIPYAHTGVLPVLEQADGQTLLLYNQGVSATDVAGKLLTAHLDALHVEADTNYVTTSSYSVPLPQSSTSSGSTPYFMNPALRGANLIYSVETFTTLPESSNLYSLPLSYLNGQDNQGMHPLQIFSDVLSDNQASRSGGPASRVAGPGAYAYVDNVGTLHAHLYDADVDVPLESGVGTIIAVNADYFYKVLH